MDTIIDEWKKLLDEFKGAVDRNVDEIRKCKAAVQSIRPDYVDKSASGRFIRSKDPIIISSPNIIIGNVDADGNLINGTPSKILLRATNVGLEGVGREGENGSIVSKATVIRQIAVDPGIDGLEAVVMPGSEIVSQAQRITIDSSADNDFFISEAHRPSPGITIKSDTSIDLNSSVGLASRKAKLETLSASLDTLIKQYQNEVDSISREIDGAFKDIQQALSDADTLKLNDEEISSKVGLLNDLRKECEDATVALNKKVAAMVASISRLAEAKREKSVVGKLKEALPKEEDYKENGSDTFIRMNADTLYMSTLDGDGGNCVSPGSGILFDSRYVHVSSLDTTGKLMDGSYFGVASMTVEFNSTRTEYSDDKKQKGTVKSLGEFNVYAKKVNVKSVDSQFDSGAQNAADKHKETALTPESSLSVRLAGIDFSTVGTDGVAAGAITMNSQNVDICSIDLDKDSKQPSKFNDKGQIVLRANKITEGCYDDKFKTTRAQILSKETLIESEGGVSLMQDKDNGVFIKDKGVSVGSTKNTVSGPVTINGATKVADKFEATTEAKIANLQVSGEFKTTNIENSFKATTTAEKKKAKKKKE
ncbi:MAG: hypothetical protein MJY56_06600, partial [Bacteroidales bacterium]|nr:hypothetical protein [Bacteroidales bacterium]